MVCARAYLQVSGVNVEERYKNNDFFQSAPLSQLVKTHVPTIWAIDQYRIYKDVCMLYSNLQTNVSILMYTGVREVSVYCRRDRGQFEDVGHLRRPSQGPEVCLRKVRF